MGYKLKRILIYPDGVTEKQVYPKKLYEYSYDFRNKSIAGMQSDGWTFGSTSGVTINSDGLTCSQFNASIYCSPSGLDLSGSNKITITMTAYKGADNSQGSNALVYLGGPSTYTSNGTGIGMGYEDMSGRRVFSLIMRLLGGDGYRGQYTVTNGTYTITETIDLSNKTMRYVFPGILDKTITLTDAQISTIRTLKYIRIGNSVNAILKSISVTVE